MSQDVPVFHVVLLNKPVRAPAVLVESNCCRLHLGWGDLIDQNVRPHLRLGRPLWMQDADDAADGSHVGKDVGWLVDIREFPQTLPAFGPLLSHVFLKHRIVLEAAEIAALCPIVSHSEIGSVTLRKPDVICVVVVRYSSKRASRPPGRNVRNPPVGYIVVRHGHLPVQSNPPLHYAARDLGGRRRSLSVGKRRVEIGFGSSEVIHQTGSRLVPGGPDRALK